MQNTIHFILQGKGGIGKSFIAVMLAQFFKSKGADLKAFDTDQENTTFAHYKALGAQHIPVMNESRTIDAKRFDALMEKLLTEDGTFVIDNGANTFSPLLAYMVENNVISFLTENDKKVYLHTVVGGGDTLADTANGFNSIAQGIGDAPVVLWLNEHFGPMKTDEGKDFTDTKVFKANQSRLHGVVSLQARNHQTYGDDIKKMNTKRLTVDEIMQSSDFALMEKQRIRNVAKDVFGQLDKIEF
ncbi:conjugal transfer protein TraL (plasmid) [Xanthomonas axonopodis pv. fascicularis]|uniref:nucleotide-binding protein n=1 Tax=Xanthomonas axonopodis TaxID=53413 RepID=UPI0035305D3F